MSSSDTLRTEFSQLAESIEKSFAKICEIWDEEGIHTQATRETMRAEYYKSCKDVLFAHINKMVHQEEEVCFMLFIHSTGTCRIATEYYGNGGEDKYHLRQIGV